jgi:hypothetical protein
MQDDDILRLRASLERQAEIIRNCSCDQGYIIGPFSRRDMPGRVYQGAAMCECYREFKRIGRLLNDAVREWERGSGREYPLLITPKMTDHSHVTGQQPSAEAMRRARLSVAGMSENFEIPVDEMKGDAL